MSGALGLGAGARILQHDFIGTGHFLLGLVHEGGLAVKLMTEIGADPPSILRE
jgi:hypothetical protein